MNDCKHEKVYWYAHYSQWYIKDSSAPNARATFCPDCGSKLTPPLEPVYLSCDEKHALEFVVKAIEAGGLIHNSTYFIHPNSPMYHWLKAIAARSRIKERE